ncbi:MAG: hypothetical protein AAFV07_07035 [Bacteroidota bacterium]
MTFLLWTAGIIFGIYWTFRLFGRQIVQFALKRVSRQLLKNAEKEAQAFRQNYDHGSDFKERVYVDNEMDVSAPRDFTPREITEDDIAEDVEFDEVK